VDPITTAATLVAERFPEALAAFLGGSVLTAARTATTDLDIVVIRPDGHDTFRETLRYRNWPVELFVSTPTTYGRFLHREITARASPLLHMVGHGIILTDPDGTATRLHHEAAQRIDQGPPPATAQQVEDLRYRLSDLLDDLDGATDPDETLLIATAVFTATAQLALTITGHWLAGGKWLGRRLYTADPDLHTALLAAFRNAASGDPLPLRTVAYHVLDRAGGRLLEGYHRTAPPDLAEPPT
jgi:hypothetical protein